jgi:hypothetical protein
VKANFVLRVYELSLPKNLLNEDGGVYDFWGMRIVTVHGKLLREAWQRSRWEDLEEGWWPHWVVRRKGQEEKTGG